MLGVDGGEPIHHATDSFLLTISINPTRRQVRDVLRSVLTNPHPRYSHVIYSGLALSGTGCWLLRDGPFTFDDFVAVLVASRDDAQHSPVCVSAFEDGSWTPTRLSRAVPDLEVVLNPDAKSSSSPPESFMESLSRRIGVVEGGTLLGETETVGSMCFARPTLYIFPGGDGGSSLFFGIRDLSIICDAGVGRRPAFWDFARHFSHVDVLVGTHTGADNVFGLKSFVERQNASELQILPKLGHVIFNSFPDLATAKQPESPPTLRLHLPEEVTTIANMLHDMGIPPQVCASPAGGKTAQKINLYQKISQGSVDLYVTQPVEDSREFKEFRRLCSSHAPNFASQSAVPLTNTVSIVAALVWKPCASTEKPVRIFLPGSAPLTKIHEGLDRLQGLPLFESLSGSAEEPAPRQTPQPVAKPAGSKPAARPTGVSQKPPPQLASAAKSSAPPKGRDQPARTVTSPKGNREVAGRRSTSKPEPVTKSGRVAKPPQNIQPSSADAKVKPATETAASGKVQAPLKNNTELPTEVGETVHDVKAEEPRTPGLEEIASRDSAERDSLEPSDDVMQADSLCGEDRDHSEVHSEDEFDPNRAIKVEKTSDSDHGETRHKDVDSDTGALDVDDRIIPGLDDKTSLLEVSSTGNRVDPNGELEPDTLSSAVNANTVAAEPDVKADEPCEDVHSRPVDDIDVDVEAPNAKKTELDELENKLSAEQQETAQEIEPVEALYKDDALGQESAAIQTTESVPDEHADELDDLAKVEDTNLIDTESDKKAVCGDTQMHVGSDFDGKHSDDLLSDLQQSVPDESAKEDELNDGEPLVEDRKTANAEVTPEPEKDAVEIPTTELEKEVEIPTSEVEKEVETPSTDSGIIPQGLPSPQKEAEWPETEQEGLDLDKFPRGEAADVGDSIHSDDDDGLLVNPAAAASVTGEKMEQDHDVAMSHSEHIVPDKHTVPDGFGELEQNTVTASVESDSTLHKPVADADEVSDLQSAVQHSEDNADSTYLLCDQKTEEIAVVTAADSNIQLDVGEKLSPDTDEPQLEKDLLGEELHGETPEDSSDADSQIQVGDQELPSPRGTTETFDHDEVPTSPQQTSKHPAHHEYPEETVPSAYDSESHIHASEHMSDNQELASPRATTEAFDDKVPPSPRQTETSKQPVHEEHPVETEPSTCDSESHDQASDHISENRELASPTVTGFDVDEVPASPKEPETSHPVPASPKEPEQVETSEQPVCEEHPAETEPTEPHDPVTDDFQHNTDIPDSTDAPDDVPVSPVEQPAQKDERASFYYTEPQIQLSEDVDHASAMELPVATGANEGQSDVEPHLQHTEDSSPPALEEPFDPLQSWGPPMGLPAPLNNDKDSGKKRESTAGRGGAAASAKDRSFLSAPKSDARTSSGGKTTGAARDVSGGRDGRSAAKPGKPAERPAATKKPAAAAADAKKVGIFLPFVLPSAVASIYPANV